jgi:hypothetical protein
VTIPAPHRVLAINLVINLAINLARALAINEEVALTRCNASINTF